MKKYDIVKYVAATNRQVKWGNNDDPRQFLRLGSKYEVRKVEVHSCHTKIVLDGFPDKKFNSVHFELVD